MLLHCNNFDILLEIVPISVFTLHFDNAKSIMLLLISITRILPSNGNMKKALAVFICEKICSQI